MVRNLQIFFRGHPQWTRAIRSREWKQNYLANISASPIDSAGHSVPDDVQGKIQNVRLLRSSHCGVLEFSAEEGRCLLPFWLMRLLLLREGDPVEVTSVELPVGAFARFQPQSVDFLEISDPRAVLERQLRNFACLSAGDVIAVEYNDRQYEVCVLETKPAPAISIFHCDLQVEFAAPVGYVEPAKGKHSALNGNSAHDDFLQPKVIIDEKSFKAFSGEGNRIDGKQLKTLPKSQDGTAVAKSAEGTSTVGPSTKQRKTEPKNERGFPDYRWQLGKLKMIRLRNEQKPSEKPDEPGKAKTTANDKPSAFTGKGFNLKPRGKLPSLCGSVSGSRDGMDK